MDNLPRGIKIFNPGNVRISHIPWQGKVTPSSDPDFETFSEMFYGIRCAAKIFTEYHLADGLSTIAQYVSRWAPSSDNNPTTGYIDYIANACGVDPNNVYNVLDASNLASMLKAVFRFEQGADFVSDNDIQQAIASL